MAAKTSPSLVIIKRIVKEAILTFAAAGFFLFVSLFLGSLAEEVATESQRIKNEVMQKSSEIQSLQVKLAQFGNALLIWNGFKNKNGIYNMKLSRDDATNIFMELRDQYAFEDIHVTVSPIRVSLDRALVRSKMQVMESDITIKMRAYSDEQIIKFIEDVKERLPGIIKVKSLRMTRNAPTAKNAKAGHEKEDIASLKGTMNVPQMDVNIDLMWFGVEEIVATSNTSDVFGIPLILGMMP